MHKKSWWAFKRMQMSLLCILTFSSCGKGYVDNGLKQEEVASGHYSTVFRPLNQRLGRSHGWASLSISDNQFWVRVKVEGPNTKATHAQYLHVNGRCPEMRDDLNHDGYLDFMEAYRVAGPILIPLDANLNSQLKGMNEFPKMRGSSPMYYYSEACNMDRLMADLNERDRYAEDMMSKLNGRELNLTKRVIIIYGINEDRSLPASVRSFEGYPSQATIPIACGEVEEGYSDAFDL